MDIGGAEEEATKPDRVDDRADVEGGAATPNDGLAIAAIASAMGSDVGGAEELASSAEETGC